MERAHPSTQGLAQPERVRTNESISEIQLWHSPGTKTDTRKAVAKLERIAALVSTLSFMIQARR
jgi:hypothetical protein